MKQMSAFRIGPWQVDPATGVLRSDGRTERLTPKVMDLLLALEARQGEVVGRDELLRAVWGERAVTDEPLTRAIAELRRALGDDRAHPRYVETIPKRGYRLIAVTEPMVGEADSPATPGHPEGDNVRLSAPSVARGRRELWLGAAAAVVAAVTIWFGFARQPVTPQAPRSVAVLPLADLNGREDMQYFADGVHDEIIARLAAIPDLRVASRNAVIAFAGPADPPAEVGERLGVESVIQGTTLHADGRVRVNVQHVDAKSGNVLWSRSFDRPLSVGSLFGIQSEIAAGVAAGFEPRDAPARSMPTSSWEAYESFLLGKYHYRRRQPGDMRLAVEYLQAAVTVDPEFAEAWDWLAYAWNHAGAFEGWTTPTEAFPRARAAATRAVELDPGNATALALLGYLRAVYDREWDAALIELERAVAMAPEESGTVWSEAYALSLLGRYDEAIVLARALVDVYPGQGRYRLELAQRLLDAGRYDEAAAAAAAALNEGAEAGLVHEVLGICAYALGEIETAAAELQRAVDLQRRAPRVLARLAAVQVVRGASGEAADIMAELETGPSGWQYDPVDLAIVHAALGDADEALLLLEQAESQRRRGVLEIRHNPFLASLRDSQRFDAILERAGLGPAVERPDVSR